MDEHGVTRAASRRRSCRRRHCPAVGCYLTGGCAACGKATLPCGPAWPVRPTCCCRISSTPWGVACRRV